MEFEQGDLEKETNDPHNTFCLNAIRFVHVTFVPVLDISGITLQTACYCSVTTTILVSKRSSSKISHFVNINPT